jgi:hypothetical protein
MIEGWKELTWASGANSIARNPSASFLSVSAPAFSKAIAVSPCPSAIAWCKGVCPATSAAFIGLLFFSNSSTIGTEPTAAARWIAYWPRLSFTRAKAGGLELRRRRAMSTFFLEEAKWRAVWPLKSGNELTGASWEGRGLGFGIGNELVALTSASFRRKRLTRSSPSLRLTAIINGVQPEPSWKRKSAVYTSPPSQLNNKA